MALKRCCPDCGSKNLYCDEVGVGVGVMRGPQYCPDCDWSEDYGSNPDQPVVTTEDDRDSLFEKEEAS